VSRRNSMLIAVVAAVAVIGAYWMLILSPKREEAVKLDGQITKQQSALATAESDVATYEAAQKHYRANYSMVARLGKAVPADDDVRSLLVQVNAAAKRAGVDFRTIDVSATGAPSTGPGAAPKSTTAPPPGASTVGTAGFSTMPFSLNFKGSFFELGKFFKRIDKFVAVRNGGLDVTGRLLLLNSITITPDTERGFPMLTADVTANSYLLPPSEGLTAGATAAGPTAGAAASGPSATPSPSAPATTTTAAISGVNP
jgi:hypothetical protein